MTPSPTLTLRLGAAAALQPLHQHCSSQSYLRAAASRAAHSDVRPSLYPLTLGRFPRLRTYPPKYLPLLCLSWVPGGYVSSGCNTRSIRALPLTTNPTCATLCLSLQPLSPLGPRGRAHTVHRTHTPQSLLQRSTQGVGSDVAGQAPRRSEG